MKKLIFLTLAIASVAIGAILGTSDVKAQCNGVFPANTFCGNNTGAAAPPAAVPATSIVASSAVNWFNVKQAPCNAVGNGVADDTAAVNTCIVEFNNASNGVLYFPAGTYLITTGLTPIVGVGVIRGDGRTNLTGFLGSTSPYTGVPAIPGTLINESHCSASLFTVNSQTATFTDLSLQNTCANPTGGAGITATSNVLMQQVDYNRIQVSSFYIDVDVQVGNGWTMENTWLLNPVLYGLKIRHILNPDYGGWRLNNVVVEIINRGAQAGIRWESSGGGLINHCGVFSGAAFVTPATYITYGIDIAGTNNTVNMGIMNCSIEGLGAAAIRVSGLPNVWISGVEAGNYGGVQSYGVQVSNATALTINGLTVPVSVSNASIGLSNCSNCIVSNVLAPWTTDIYGGGPHADHDFSGGVGGQVAFVGTSNLSLQQQRLIWTSPANLGPDLQAVLNSGFSTGTATIEAINDIGTTGGLVTFGSANGTLADVGSLLSSKGLVALSDSSVVTGGTHDISLRAGGFFQEALLVQHNGHIYPTALNQATPIIAGGCGGTSSLVTGSDTSALITGQNTAVTSCILQFGNAFTNAPICTASGVSAPLTGTITSSTTSLTVHFGSATSYQWTYHCLGK